MLISHISDLHVDNSLKKQNIRKFELVLKHLAETNIDHLIITGDLTQNAKLNSLKNVREVMQDYGFMNSKKSTIIIGNHDIYGGVHYVYDVVQFPKRCRTTDYDKKVIEFSEVFSELYESCKFSVEGNYYPFAKDLGPVVLYGLNSISRYSYLKNPFASNGTISRTNMKLLTELFYEPKFIEKKKIVLIHHHFNKEEFHSAYSTVWQKIERQSMKLYRKKKLIKMFSRFNVDLVLHGHRHEIREYEKKGVKFINAGGSLLNVTGNIFNINMITVKEDKLSNRFEVLNIYPVEKQDSDMPDNITSLNLSE